MSNPNVTSVSPHNVPLNQEATVTIQGTTLANATSVFFGTVQATILTNTNTEITVTVPSQNTSNAVNVIVTTSSGANTAGYNNAFVFGLSNTPNPNTWLTMTPTGRWTANALCADLDGKIIALAATSTGTVWLNTDVENNPNAWVDITSRLVTGQLWQATAMCFNGGNDKVSAILCSSGTTGVVYFTQDVTSTDQWVNLTANGLGIQGLTVGAYAAVSLCYNSIGLTAVVKAKINHDLNTSASVWTTINGPLSLSYCSSLVVFNNALACAIGSIESLYYSPDIINDTNMTKVFEYRNGTNTDIIRTVGLAYGKSGTLSAIVGKFTDNTGTDDAVRLTLDINLPTPTWTILTAGSSSGNTNLPTTLGSPFSSLITDTFGNINSIIIGSGEVYYNPIVTSSTSSWVTLTNAGAGYRNLPQTLTGNGPVSLYSTSTSGMKSLLGANSTSGNMYLNQNLNLVSISSISPTTGPSGVTIQVTGTNFNDCSSVTFGSTGVTGSSITPTSLVVVSPSGDTGTTSHLQVNTPVAQSVQTSSDVYEYADVPVISGISPSSGYLVGGYQVTISGSNFTSSPTVTFGGLNGSNITVSETTSITVTVPAGSALGAVTVVVTCNGLPSIANNVGSNQFTYLANPVPTISDISPQYLSFVGFTPVTFTVTGTNFTDNSVIKEQNDNTIIPISVTPTSLVFSAILTPYYLSYSYSLIKVYDTVFNTTSNNFQVYFVFTSYICNLSPSSGSTGTSVTLTGDVATLEGNIVIHFGSTTIDQFLPWSGSPTTVPTRRTTTFLVPDLPPGSYTVYFTNVAGSSPSTTFSIVDQPPGQPTVSSVTANRGSATVSFTPAAGPLATDYTITATPGGATGNVLYPLTSGAVTSLGSPAGTQYTFTVTPRNSAGDGPPSAASNSTTVYSNPTSVSLVPSATTMTDGTQLTMTPTFTNATTANIKYGSQQVNVISGSGNPYTIPSPPTNTTTVYTLEVSNAGYTATPYATTSVISVPAPSITAFSAIPSQSITVGDSLSLTGTFTGGTGTVSTTGYSSNITSGLALVVPSPEQTTTYNLAVTNSAGATATATPLTVNVYPAPSISTFTSTPSQGITIGESVPLRLNTTFTGGTGIISTTTGYSSSITSGTPLTVTPRPTQTTTYNLAVTNSAGATATATPLTVNVYPAPSISSFTSNPSQGITIGSSASLTGTFTGGTGTVSTTGGYLSDITSGTALTVTPSETTTYSLVVTNSIGATATATPLTVNVYPVPTISNFTMSPTIITVGDSVAVNATVTGSTNTEILYGPVGSSPSSIPYASIIYPTTSGNYQLQASNQVGYSVLSSNIFDISVNGPPSISSFTADPLEITVGSSSTLRATFSNGSATYSTNGGAFVPFTSGTSVNPTQNSTYVLRVTNLAEDTIDSSPVTVIVYSLPTGSLTASTVTNNTVVLTPSFPSPNTGSINNNVGTVTSGVTYPVQIFNTTTYILTVSNPLGVTQTYSQKVTIPLTRVSLGNQKFSVVSNPLQTIFTPILPVVIQGGTVNKTYSMTPPPGSKLPELGINSSTGVVKITSISGVSVGDYTYTVTVTDGDSQTLSNLQFVITVLSAPSTYTSYSKFTGANYNDLTDLQRADVVNSIGQQILAANPSTTVQYIDLSNGSIGATAGTTTVAPIPESTISVDGITITNIVCFLQTCNIKMLDGTYRNIQDIVNGDVLLSALTGTGIRVTHCGYNTVSDLSRLHSTNHPMRIPRDFFGEGSPAHDVFMSGHHRLFFSINGHALGLQAFKVVGMENVLTMEEALRVTNSTELRYYHVEVEGGKNAVFCDGLPVETLDSDEWDEGRCVENK
jgi:hypothetical protein